MAQYSTGITATWNSQTFNEVRSLSWQWGAARQDRGLGTAQGWTPEPGSVTLTCLGTGSNVTTGNVGKLYPLSITGGGAALSCNAVFESLSVQPELNGVTQYSITLKIVT